MKKVAPLIERPAGKSAAARARKSLDALRNHARLTLVGAPPPPEAMVAFKRVLEAMAEGGGVAVVPLDAELTTQDAADLLGISRPSLVKLLDQGAIPYRTLGVHRRLKATDVLAYRRTRDAKRRRALDKLAAENQRLGLYED